MKASLSLTLIPSDTRIAGHKVTRHEDFGRTKETTELLSRRFAPPSV